MVKSFSIKIRHVKRLSSEVSATPTSEMGSVMGLYPLGNDYYKVNPIGKNGGNYG